MSENIEYTNEQNEESEEKIKKINDTAEALKKNLEERKKKNQESFEAMKEGKGKLALSKPITSEDQEITELEYDFTELTGMEYIEAMDSDPNSQQAFRITYRQALALFAKAAEKHVATLDSKDIITRIGATDAVEGVQLATLFFNTSTREGRTRISKR